MTLPDTEETDVQGIILKYLELRQIRAWRANAGMFKRGGHWIHGAPEGTPDIVGYLRDARFLGIECKRERGSIKTGAAQIEFAADLNACGGVGIITRTLRDVERRLDAERA
jgi:hypothetical protein